jgi:excisionase family DNA binding protein
MAALNKPFYSTSESAKLLGVSVTTIQGLVESGALTAWKTAGGHRRITGESILAVQGMPESLVTERIDKSKATNHVVMVSSDQLNISSKCIPLDIMIVEDDPFMVSVYEGALSDYSGLFDLRVCVDGLDALIELGKRPPDFIFLDLDLPNVNGFEMLRSLHKRQAKKLIQVLVITGLEPQIIEQHSELLSMYTVQTKPIEHLFLKGYLSSLFATRKAATALYA